MLNLFMQNYRKRITFTEIRNYDLSYKNSPVLCEFMQIYYLMKQLNKKENKVSFEILMIKIDQILIKLHDIL